MNRKYFILLSEISQGLCLILTLGPTLRNILENLLRFTLFGVIRLPNLIQDGSFNLNFLNFCQFDLNFF